jgi:hypothetical protein
MISPLRIYPTHQVVLLAVIEQSDQAATNAGSALPVWIGKRLNNLQHRYGSHSIVGGTYSRQPCA